MGRVVFGRAVGLVDNRKYRRQGRILDIAGDQFWLLFLQKKNIRLFLKKVAKKLLFVR
jgi:hypothetical protein